VTSGYVQLPLNEYHDPLAKITSRITTARLENVGPDDRPVNPGRTTLLNATLTNIGASSSTYQLNVTGTHGAWARILGPSQVTLALDEHTDITVAVSVPANATAPDRADLVLLATPTDNLTDTSLVRMAASITKDIDIPDEAPYADQLDQQLSGHKSSPNPMWLAVVALALVAMRRRVPA
jgi:hypothetical protein